MTFDERIKAASSLLRDAGYSSVRGHRVNESVAQSRIALALAVKELADAAKADAATSARPPAPWPADVTARFLTRYGQRYSDQHATVDIHDNDTRSTARCLPCGWTKDRGLTYRSEVLAWAQDHADQCMALGQPTA